MAWPWGYKESQYSMKCLNVSITAQSSTFWAEFSSALKENFSKSMIRETILLGDPSVKTNKAVWDTGVKEQIFLNITG